MATGASSDVLFSAPILASPRDLTLVKNQLSRDILTSFDKNRLMLMLRRSTELYEIQGELVWSQSFNRVVSDLVELVFQRNSWEALVDSMSAEVPNRRRQYNNTKLQIAAAL